MQISQSIFIIIVLIIYFIIYSQLFNRNLSNYLNSNWRNIRCQPHIIPIAGLSDAAKGSNFFSKTINNFNSCTSGYIKSFMIILLKPFIAILDGLKNGMNSIRRIIDVFRRMSKVLREMFAALVENTAKRMANSYSAIMYFQEKLKVLIKKQTAIFEILSQFAATIPFLLYSFSRGPIPRFGIWLSRYAGVLVAVFVVCLACLLGGPFTKMVACPICAVCFTGETLVQLPNNNTKCIKNINIGDTIKDNIVLGKLYIKKHMADTYIYNNTFVSGSHLVLEDSKWKRIEDSDLALPRTLETDLYCLITSNNTITINNTIYRDYEETQNKNVKLAINYKIAKHVNNNKICLQTRDDINHTYYWGFDKSTKIYVGDMYVNINHIVENPDKYPQLMGSISMSGENINMFNYKGVIISGSTLVYENGIWLRIHQTKDAKPVDHVDIVYNVISNSNNNITVQSNFGNIVCKDFIESSDDSINDEIDKVVQSSINF